MKIILTRHGETEETKNGILQGQLPGKLSLYGMEQAKELAKKLKDEQIDIIFSSDLDRSLHTAQEIHKYHQNIPLHSDKLLRERSFGNLEGKNKNDIGFYDQDQQHFFDNPKNGETLKKVYNRALEFYNNLFEKYIDKNILVVSHDDIGKALVSVITGKQSNDIVNILSMRKASITIFEVNKNRESKNIIYGNIEHLKK